MEIDVVQNAMENVEKKRQVQGFLMAWVVFLSLWFI